MGADNSTTNTGNSGNTGNRITNSNNSGNIYAQRMPNLNFAPNRQFSSPSSYAPIHAANAFPSSLRLFYSPDKLTLSDLIQGTELTSGGSVQSIVLKAGENIECPVYEDLYVTAFSLPDPSQLFYNPKRKPLFENFLFETTSGQHKSAVITARGEPRFTKDGEIWVDESGQNHKPRK